MLKTIAIAAAAVVAAVLVYASTKPDTFRVQRSTTVSAPPAAVYALIDDFHRWGEWSPFEKLDPAMRRTFDGAPRGVGAVYAWAGNGKAGAGRMEIVEARPTRVAIRLDFEKPMRVRNTAEFTLEPAGEATRVTWAMHGPNLFIGKVIGLFVDMDRMVGRDFEAGLAALKAAAERDAAAVAAR